MAHSLKNLYSLFLKKQIEHLEVSDGVSIALPAAIAFSTNSKLGATAILAAGLTDEFFLKKEN